MPLELGSKMLIALEHAALFMDMAIERNGEWQDAFAGDLAEVYAAIRAAKTAGLGRSRLNLARHDVAIEDAPE